MTQSSCEASASGRCSSEDLHRVLKDCIDAVMAQRPTAMVHWTPEIINAWADKDPLASKTIPDVQNVSLPVVDFMTHEGIWACIDDGCNMACHGDKWAANAEAKLAKWGFKAPWKHRRDN